MQCGAQSETKFSGWAHPDFEDVTRSLLRVLPRRGEGGAAICVYHRGKCVVDLWAGTRDECGTPWQEDSLALSWSTTKGVLSTLMHIWVDRGCADYDDPVARYWPEFASKGKGEITLRQVMCHEAGLHRIGDMLEHAREMLEWDRMVAVLENHTPAHRPGAGLAYHGLTYGWLVGELIERIGGADLACQIQRELVEPLKLDGLHLGLPLGGEPKCAKVLERPCEPAASQNAGPERRREILGKALGIAREHPCRSEVEAALLPYGFETLDWNSREVLEAAIPAVGGLFTARSLARLYAMLSRGGELDGVRLLSEATLARATRVQNDAPGQVIPVGMQWRLGYHRVPVVGTEAPAAFGHFGLGGSGAWADPARSLAVALVLNSGIGTPLGDTRIVRVSSAAVRAADARASAA